MPDELTAGTTDQGTGQSTADPESTGAPAGESQATAGGQPGAGDGAATTDTGTQTTEPTEFFDPTRLAELSKDLPPDVLSQVKLLQKELQGSYTKKTQTIADSKRKIQAFDAFEASPVEAMQQMAGRMGYKLTRAEAAAQVNQMQQGDQNQAQGQAWEPKSWDEVLQRATQVAQQNIMKSLQPVLGQATQQRKETIESQLTEIDPSWNQYEDAMVETLKKHPTLKNDPANLYRMSVPAKVLESRATKAALKQMESKANSAQVGGASTTTKLPPAGMPDKALNFNDAVKFAKQQIAEGKSA